ncbi:universal stress protein [Neobacillus fumarioli]|uniref:universal stress protein n=1 Tax=Neobacillus fumarioli TaxID=105229 RepID=UPI00082CFE1F|nr:universal stress protein [Neobacillus fumarioli]
MYKKILTAFDGSEPSARALEHAAQLAKAVGTEKLTILYINKEVPMPEPALNIDLNQLLNEENKKILAPAVQFLSEININYETHSFEGEPAHVLTMYAREHHYDLIVMGSEGKGLIKEALIGSVSHKVVQTAHCPVLILK